MRREDGNHRESHWRAMSERRYTGDASKVTASGCATALSKLILYLRHEKEDACVRAHVTEVVRA